MSKKWYVINTNPKCEGLVERQLHNLGIEVFLPKITSRRGRREPLFPGYLFVRTDFLNQQTTHAKFMHGVRRWLGLGGRPVSLEQSLIDFIKTRLGKTDGQGGPCFKPGDRVRFIQGAFQGLGGVFVGNMSGRDRVRILIDSVYLNSKVDVSLTQITKVS